MLTQEMVGILLFIGRQPVTEPKQSGGEAAWRSVGATACDRAKAERRRGCMTCSFPEEVHNPRRSPPNPWRPTPHATLFPLFSPKRCLFRSFHASYLSYFVKLRPKNNSFFHINAPALLLKQPLFVLMQLFFTFTPI